MVDPQVARSPQLYARAAGVLYLYIIVAGTFAEVFVRGRLVDPSNAGVTAQNILNHETLFRLAASAELLHLACDVAVTVVLYLLLQVIHGPIALLATFMRFACIVILGTVAVTPFAALRLVRSAEYLTPLGSGNREALAVLAMQVHSDGYTISLMFFGFSCVALGYLIYRSTFLPRLLGVMMTIAGLCYLLNSFAQFLRLGFAAKLFPALFIPIFVAELSLSVWLFARGVRTAEFRRIAQATNSFVVHLLLLSTTARPNAFRGRCRSCFPSSVP